MKLIILLASYLGLFSFLWFCELNVLFHIKNENGYEYLLIFISTSIFILFLNHKKYNLQLNLRIGLLLLFFVYFVLNAIFDGMDSTSIFSYIFGSTGGMLFSLVCGVFSSVLLNEIHNAKIASKKFRKFVHFLLLAMVFWIVYENFLMLQEFKGRVRLDLFLMEDRDLSYQRIGNYILVKLMITISLVVLAFSLQPLSLTLRIIFMGLMAFDSVNIFFASQLVGSNSGAIASVGLYLFALVFVLTSYGSSIAMQKSFIGIMWGFLNLCRRHWKEIGLAVAVGVVFLVKFDFEWDSLRVFRYGDLNASSSFDTRVDIFRNYAAAQFFYNPVFGNTLVDSLTSGEGTYVHSIPVSVQTHLGVVGLIIFLILNYKIFKKIKIEINQRAVDGNPKFLYYYFSYLGIVIVLVAGTVSAFFNWMPYWFALGFWGGLILKNNSYGQPSHLPH
jgi:hypothetical protein